MVQHGRIPRPAWFASLAVIGFIAVHGIVLYYIPSHATVSAVALSGVLILLAIKLALLGGGHSLLRRLLRRNRD